jgi:hypothetical protein
MFTEGKVNDQLTVIVMQLDKASVRLAGPSRRFRALDDFNFVEIYGGFNSEEFHALLSAAKGASVIARHTRYPSMALVIYLERTKKALS